MRVSDLTRDMLRRTLTVFMGTGAKRPDGSVYSAPYQHQGTGTINTLVLALLSIIAELKQSVIFAMEEPEIALPPHTQKRIINSLRQKSAQAIFTSHSPYVLEEFEPAQVVVLKRTAGVMTGCLLHIRQQSSPRPIAQNSKHGSAKPCWHATYLYLRAVRSSTHCLPLPAGSPSWIPRDSNRSKT